MRLDLFESVQIPGTHTPEPGVVPCEADRPTPSARPGWLHALGVLLLALSLLGQGERYRIDPRFRTPSATLQTYWEALREGDAFEAWECFVEGRHELPEPGMLWFLPPTEDLWLTDYRSLPVSAGRVMVTYDVHYRRAAGGDEHLFRSGSELVRIRGEWRIAQPIGEANMPEWKPVPSPVDI